MTDQMQTVREDLAFVRTLAAEGRNAPPLGGAILFARGLIWAATSLAAWAVQTRVLPYAQAWSGAVWPVGMVVFMGALVLLIRRHRGKPGAGAVNNRVMRTAWSATGWSIFAFVGAVAAASWRLGTPLPTVMIAPFVLCVYGVGWVMAASMSGERWLSWTAFGSFSAAVVMGFLANSPSQYLVYAAALLLLMALPGWLLLRQEPADVSA